MTLVHESSSLIAEPSFFAVGPHAPQVADRTLREEHADISVLLLLAAEAARAEVLGQRRWASWLRTTAAAALPSSAGSNADTYRAELVQVRAVLAGGPAVPGLLACGSSLGDTVARAGVRASALAVQVTDPDPLLTQWLAHTVAASSGRERSRALRCLRRHLLVYGIDPSDEQAAAVLDHRWRQDLGATGWVYFGVLEATGTHLWTGATISLASLARTNAKLSRPEARQLRRTRRVEVDPGAWRSRLVGVIDTMLAQLPAGV